VTGDQLSKPSNLWVPLGTGLDELIRFSGGDPGQIDQVILGGPMMGMVQKRLNIPVIKGTSGVLANRPLEEFVNIQSCIRCGRCIDACPLFLNPARLGLMSRKKLWEEMDEYHVMDCFECGSCSYVCPSNIPLVQNFRVAKGFIRERKSKMVNKTL
ncbi:MAG: 4Fe-4S dicluster domain-containing protein, partial [Cyclobacteriaceae bacterium]|nr:4Fe-4S dicluster domain-containing protein [Cyclobacteriaceae bacterium]